MGDRTWTGISFTGHINETQAADLAAELTAQGCHCDDGPEGELSVEHLKLDTCFFDEECNYASMEEVEQWCRDNNVGYLKTWSAGGGYGEGVQLYMHLVNETIDLPQCEGEVAIGVEQLKDFKNKGCTIEDVLRYVDLVDNYRTHFPPLVVQ